MLEGNGNLIDFCVRRKTKAQEAMETTQGFGPILPLALSCQSVYCCFPTPSQCAQAFHN
jgi:hypothetical protein